MTDILSGVGAALDDQFTSPDETKPKAAPAPALVLTCRYCPQTFEGGARYVQRGLHEKRQHPDDFKAAKAGVKPKKKTTKKAQPRATPVKAGGPVGKKRTPAGESIASVLSMVAQVVIRVDPPVGRALRLSSTATGEAVDGLVAGTIVDRLVIQKFAGAADKWEKVGGIVSFPILVAVISRNPALYDPLESQLRSAVLDVITASVPTLEKQKSKEKKAIDALRRLGQVDERFANTPDPIGLILRDIFAAPEPMENDGEAV